MAFLIMLGVLITIHELGHFLFARLFGVKVESFSIGFGPPIFKWKGKETEYQIALIPLGGYVKMYGEDSMTEPIQGNIDKSAFSDPRSFHSKPNWQKMLIAFAGPLFNIVLAIILFIAVYIMGVKEPAYLSQPVVVGYVEKNSIAEKVGIQPFDKIVKVNGKEVKNWKEFTIEIGMKAGKNVEIEILRNGSIQKISVILPEDMTKQSFGISPVLPAKVGKVLENSPAAKAGLKEGDIIVGVNGRPINTWFEFADFMASLKEKQSVNLLVKRDNKIFSIMLEPQYNEELKKYTIGIAPKFETVTIQYSPIEAVGKALEKTKDLTVAIYNVVAGLITGEVSFKTLGGPISIAKFSGEALETGVSTFLFAMAFISLQLGYLNLLPIPVLDGGLILILLIETIIRRPLPDKAKEYLAYFGFALLGTLMIYVIFNDILRVIQ
ncbi:RIP metalloprotease RseP [Sulfurihydrogenibium azorense]|uniref:RIP metalloprotease RseP n=1 Tax=Sulfurihydrogenibium azorense TaxID=309806 RepID=UPI001E48FF7A|nr:RIP metalloprotease RseP [Sulfurihydrogenibium azorense]MDM7273007.1 RIP metalloprotease RseP [Sulfurihydrogenibium azorense]